MTVTLASTPDDLWTALHDAAPGDTVQVATGDYGVFYVPAVIHADPGVLIMPAPDAKPVFTLFGIGGPNCSGYTARKLTVRMAPATQYGISVVNCENAVVRDCTVQQADGQTLAGTGIYVRNAKNVMILNNEVSFVGCALCITNSTFVLMARNSYHDIQTDGILLCGARNCAVVANEARDFHTAGGGHPDAIQGFSDSSTGAACINLSIDGNYIEVGHGDQIQGVLMQDSSNIWITDNAQLGTMTNGISLSRCNHCEVDHNFLQGYQEFTLGPSIMIRGACDDIAVTNNTVAAIAMGVPSDGPDNQPVNCIEEGNVPVALASGPDDYTAYDAWKGS